MRGLLLLAAGVVGGFAAAHLVNQTPRGRQFFEDVDSRTRDFGSSVVDGYKQREAELRAAVADAEGLFSDSPSNP